MATDAGVATGHRGCAGVVWLAGQMVRSCGYCVAVWVLCGWADGVVAAVFILTVVVSCVIVHRGCCHHGGGGGGVRSLWLCGCCHCCLLVAGILAASPQPEEEAAAGRGGFLTPDPLPSHGIGLRPGKQKGQAERGNLLQVSGGWTHQLLQPRTPLSGCG